jgi:predicted nucleic-acid-binding protein
MRAVDTSVLVHLITRDDPKQAAKAEAFIKGGAWVSHVVVVETVWVLKSVYALDDERIQAVLEVLLGHVRVPRDREHADRRIVIAKIAAS